MKHLSTVAIGLVGVVIGWVIGPLLIPVTRFDAYLPTLPIVFVIYAPIVIAFGAAIVGTLDAAHLATRRADLSARRALGQTRASLIRAEVAHRTWTGALGAVGGLAVGSLAVTGSTALFTETLSAGAEVDWPLLLTLLEALAMLVAASALGALGAALWATSTPRGAAATEHAGPVTPHGAAPVDESGRTARRARWPWWVGTVAVLGLLPYAFPEIVESDGVVAIVLSIVFGLALYLGAPTAIVLAASTLGDRLVRALGRWATGRVSPGTARGLAADALARRMPLRLAALGAIGLVISIAAAASVFLNGMAERNELADALKPDAYVSTAELQGDGASGQSVAMSSGWAPALDPQLIADLEADERLVVVRGAVLISEGGTAETVGGDTVPGDTVLAVEPDALDGLAEAGLRALYLDDGVQIGGGWTLTVDDVTTETSMPSSASPFNGVSRSWAERIFGTAPDSALLVYVADTVTRTADTAVQDSVVTSILAEHDLGGVLTTVPDHYDSVDYGQRADASSLLRIAGPFLLGAVGLVVALTVATQRLRAREYATLAALGVQAATLRSAAALEAATITAVASGLGLLSGAIIGIGLSAFDGAGGPGIRLWNLGFDLAQVPWFALAGLSVAAVALAAGLAALVRVRVDSRTPAEQLRTAEKEGVR